MHPTTSKRRKASGNPRVGLMTGTYENLDTAELIELLRARDSAEAAGIRVTYSGQTPPWQIVRRVRPRRQRIQPRLCVGTELDQSRNLILEGENLQAMVSLYKYRGQVDLIIADPPYNTGQDFRYNDRWDTDPNDPDLGSIVPRDDGSRHSKWLRFITPRLWMMKEMLKPSGVIAVFIGDDELFRLGMQMDAIFNERNRLGVINWQKVYKTKKQAKHLGKATEYVLLYEKAEGASERLERLQGAERSPAIIDRNSDNDPEGAWTPTDPTGPGGRAKTDYGLQSPEDGHMYYPAANRHWAWKKSKIKKWIEEWGSEYVELEDPNCRSKSLVLEGSRIKDGQVYTPPEILRKARAKASVVRKGVLPFLLFVEEGRGRPMRKLYRKDLERGQVPMTYWAHEEFDRPIAIGSQSWSHQHAGTSKRGTTELKDMLGNVTFETVKPLEIVEKLVHLWCAKDGLVLDPFAGTGTTAHAVLNLNALTGVNRRFVLIEQGRPERGDPYARALTAARVKRAITGKWASGERDPLGGGFRFTELTSAVDAEAVLALEREEMIDLLITTYWDQAERSSSYLTRLPAGEYKHLFATSSSGEGYFLIWERPDQGSALTRTSYREVIAAAQAANLRAPYHIYARRSAYTGPGVEFYQIPDRILEKLGFNEALEPFSHTLL